MNIPRKKLSYKIILVIAGILIVGGITAFAFREQLSIGNSDNSNDKASKPSVNSPASTEDEDVKDEGNTGHSDSTTQPDSRVVDTEGRDSQRESESDGQRSESGVIELLSPTQNSTISNSTILSGNSSSSTVNYRILNNLSGVIGQGELNVVNGKFSGNIQIHSPPSEGKIVVFTFRDGIEVEHVEVNVSYGR